MPIGRDKHTYYPFINIEGKIHSVIDDLVKYSKPSEIVFIDTNLIWSGTLNEYFQNIPITNIKPKIIEGGRDFAGQIEHKILKNNFVITKDVKKELENLESQLEKNIGKIKDNIKLVPSNMRTDMRNSLKEYQVILGTMWRKIKYNNYEINHAELYSPVMEFINYIDDTLVEAKDSADREIATCVLHEALISGINTKKSKKLITTISSDKKVRELIKISYELITSYEPTEQQNAMIKGLRTSENHNSGSELSIIEYNEIKDTFKESWNSYTDMNGPSLGIYLASKKDQFNQIIRIIQQKLNQINRGYSVALDIEAREEVIEEVDETPGVKWLRKRYMESRIPLDLIGTDPRALKEKLRYEEGALEVAHALGAEKLEEIINSEVKEISEKFKNRATEIKEKRLELANKGNEYFKKIKEGINVSDLDLDMPKLYEKLEKIDEELKGYEDIQIKEIKKVDDKIYSSAEIIESLGITKAKFNSTAASLKQRKVLPKRGRDKYTESDFKKIKIASTGKALSKAAEAAGMSSPKAKRLLKDYDFEDEIVQVGATTYFSEDGIEMLSNLK